MTSTSCVFCGLLADQGEATWVARRERASAFLPLAEGRLSPAHTVVVPNDHALGIHDASAESLQAVVLLAQEVARAMEESIGARGVNILNASGPDSDQSVPHLHLHVVPRWKGDGLDTWPSTVSSHSLDDAWLSAVRAAMTP
ncbi:HIT family protein [Brachybacterium sp. ACRRE]|uniref:HIT family protein n=1 Tax=Brachybacterium sp. ACRRE TaxID=2918184 RepID=UPI001EF2D289|nr:HIT family protein [Brachybacterium sp. ACRRE]MCG7308343.1 HIT family protein [Brachybacterium sp. ACRRE]